MKHKTYQPSWLLRCLFVVVYFIFFAVQLHYRYASSAAPHIQTGLSLSALKVQKDQGVEKSTESSKGKPQLKLNKRFYPTPVYEAVALYFRFQPPMMILEKDIATPTPPLCRTRLTCSSLRGPPIAC